MLTMMQKRDDFAAYLQTLMRVHESRYIVETLERKELHEAADRKTRVKVMGSPCFYATVYDLGAASVADLDGAGNVCDFEGHALEVRIFWQNDYATTYATSSQKLFEEMVYNAEDAAKPGLLATIRGNRTRYVGTTPYIVGLPGADAFQGVQRGMWDLGDLGRPDLCHYIRFTVTLY